MLKFDKSKLVKNLAHGNILAPYLDRAFGDFEEPWTFKYEEKWIDDAWHPSGDCTPHVTSLYAKASDPDREREPISLSLRKSFMVGHYWHQVLQYIVLHKLHFCEPLAIERRGWEFWGEVQPILIVAQDDDAIKGAVPLTPEANRMTNTGKRISNTGWGVAKPYHWVTGMGDVAPLDTGHWRGIVDFKTMSSQQFKQPTLPQWAALKYVCQANIYMDLFDEEKALILAINKDAPHDFKEFEFARDQDLIDAIYSKWKFVAECIDAGVVPTIKDNVLFALPGQIIGEE